MKKLIALVLCFAMLLACTAALAETEKESMGTLKVNKAFDIRYSALPDGYTVSIYEQNDMHIIANIATDNDALPDMGLVIAFSDQWADVERLNDLSDEDLQVIRDSFIAEYEDVTFETMETSFGTRLLTVMGPGNQDAVIFTIYRGHEIEMHLIPGPAQDALSDADLDRVVAFLSDMDFVPVEE